MKFRFILSLIVLCSLFPSIFAQGRKKITAGMPPPPAAQSADSATKLPIKRVILYSNGVAYIERRGIISGNAEVNLSFKQSQVDDVLKSMVVLDLGQGRIGAVSYNSSLPASARTAEIPFGISATSDESDSDGGGMAGVLSQLQGARVAVNSSKGIFSGSILTVEKKNIVSKKDDSTNLSSVGFSLVIANDLGEISSLDLADIRSIKLLDEGARQDISEFAKATASTRRRDAKTITVTSNGSGNREMIVSYTIAAPIWKTTYRVVLDEAGKPFFQGWAIIDNVSEEDWRSVQMSLISGTPISFIQPIQKPLYRYRPVVPIPEDLNLEPQVYDEEEGGAGYGSGNANGDGTGSGDEAPPPPKPTPLGKNEVSNFRVAQQAIVDVTSNSATSNSFSTGLSSTGVSDALVNNSGVETAAKGEEIGDLFEYRIEQPVTVLRDRSALIPIVQTKMDGERVSIYNEAARKDRPMSGMLLKNLTSLTFENGSLTVIDSDAYVGEALMERLKPKEQRLISYALDLATLVTVDNKEDREPAKLVKVVNGVFQVHYFRTDKKIYKAANQSNRKKILYIEHPVSKDWVLSEGSAKPDYTTARYYRFRIELDPFEKEEVVVAENQPLVDSYALTDITSRDLELFLTRRYINDATKAKLNKLIDLRGQINQIEARLNSFEDEQEKIAEDQKRLRENIETLSKTPEAKVLITRYIDKVNQQETRIEGMEKERQALESDKMKLEIQLAAEIRNFEIQ